MNFYFKNYFNYLQIIRMWQKEFTGHSSNIGSVQIFCIRKKIKLYLINLKFYSFY